MSKDPRHIPLSVKNIKYIPYKDGKGSFVIPKIPKVNYGKCPHGLPIPPNNLWIGYGENQEEYLESGKDHMEKMMEIVKDSGFSLKKRQRVLDFGCGAGRMVRHLKKFSGNCEIWGADVNAKYIVWCKQYLSPPFHFFTSTTIPHLPFEDGYFNFVYAGSVFTHIDDLAEAWLLELRRILSPNGRLYITISDKHSIKLLETDYKKDWLSKKILTHHLFKKSKDNLGMLALSRDAISQIFYDIEYFSEILAGMYQIISMTKEAYGFQTAILLKKINAR